MTKGRKPKPTHLKLITGNPGKRRLRADSIQPLKAGVVPEPPAHLLPEAKEEWKRLAPGMTTLNLLSELDRAAFGAYCQSYGRWAQAEILLQKLSDQDASGRGALLLKSRAGNVFPNPLVWIARNAANDMVRYAAEFGFTPSSRSRLAPTAPAAGSKFDGLLGSRFEW